MYYRSYVYYGQRLLLATYKEGFYLYQEGYDWTYLGTVADWLKRAGH